MYKIEEEIKSLYLPFQSPTSSIFLDLMRYLRLTLCMKELHFCTNRDSRQALTRDHFFFSI